MAGTARVIWLYACGIEDKHTRLLITSYMKFKDEFQKSHIAQQSIRSNFWFRPVPFFPWLVRVVSDRSRDRSVRYNGKHAREHTEWLVKNTTKKRQNAVNRYQWWKTRKSCHRWLVNMLLEANTGKNMSLINLIGRWQNVNSVGCQWW